MIQEELEGEVVREIPVDQIDRLGFDGRNFYLFLHNGSSIQISATRINRESRLRFQRNIFLPTDQTKPQRNPNARTQKSDEVK